MQSGLSYKRNVCLWVRPSVKRVDSDKTKEILTPHERTFILVFELLPHKEWLVGDDHLYLKFWAKLTIKGIRNAKCPKFRQ